MTALISPDLTEKIEQLTSMLAKNLGIDVDFIPGFLMPEDKEVFPQLSANAHNEIKYDNKLLAKTIDHTILKADAEPADIVELCAEAIQNEFFAVCVNSAYTEKARAALYDSNVQLAVVVGFPLGQMSSESKAFEALHAVKYGASEIDMVINVGLLKAGLYLEVFQDICDVIVAAKVPVKVIIETALLTEHEKIIACLLARFAGAAFVKTSTGFANSGATVADVALMRQVVQDRAGVKASGGIKTRDDALAMIKAGANRIGTSSGLLIVGK